MRYFLVILAFLIPTSVFAITGDAARFDFSQGSPSITDDATTACNNTTTVRYDFTNGMPSPVYDSTAVCTADASVSVVEDTPRYIQMQGKTTISQGTMIIK